MRYYCFYSNYYYKIIKLKRRFLHKNEYSITKKKKDIINEAHNELHK